MFYFVYLEDSCIMLQQHHVDLLTCACVVGLTSQFREVTQKEGLLAQCERSLIYQINVPLIPANYWLINDHAEKVQSPK